MSKAPDDKAGAASPAPTAQELKAAIKLLQSVAQDRLQLGVLNVEERRELFEAAGRVATPTQDEERRLRRALRKQERKEQRDADRSVVDQVGVRTQRRLWGLSSSPSPPLLAKETLVQDAPADDANAPRLGKSRNCYVCKKEYSRVHFFYDAMCPECGDLNHRKRSQTADLTGRVAVITGARLKIGYQAALMLLRAGARVVVCTRFPVDSAQRYAKEKDFLEWKDRLQVFGLDLRHAPSVELFTHYLDRTLDRLDFLINNAAQTVRRPPGFYAHLMPEESQPLQTLPAAVKDVLEGHAAVVGSFQKQQAMLPANAEVSSVLAAWQPNTAGMGLWASARLSQLPYSLDDAAEGAHVFPHGRYDLDRQQVDLRDVNSWRLKLADVPIPEMLEVQLVNVVAPFILNARLKPLMLRQKTWDKHVVNVSAMEGQFSRGTKTDKHPHTNMAKASLNMMTRTSAMDYVKDGIHMNSVDTGWVSDEDPAVHAARKEEETGWQPPLDIVDGAARILDPIFDGLNSGQHLWGKFLKDYKPTEW